MNDCAKDNQSWTGSNDTLNVDSDGSEFADDNARPCSSGSNDQKLNSRRLPSRACKESSMLHKTKRRSIMKPKRLVSATGNLRPAAIRKIYLNKKLGHFHPSKLETIFEEPLPSGSGDDSDVCLIGVRKLKRSLSCCDGLNVNKTLINQRRLKIKKTFGKRFALKKILLEDFLQRLNESLEGNPEAMVEQVCKDQLLLPPSPHEGILLKSSLTCGDVGLPKVSDPEMHTVLKRL